MKVRTIPLWLTVVAAATSPWTAYTLTAYTMLSPQPGKTATTVHTGYVGRLALATRKKERSRVVEISFVKSGGLAGPMTRVQGTVHLGDASSGDLPSHVTGDAAYQRQLAPSETEMLRAGAQPDLLTKAAAGIAAPAGGAADLEQYAITVRTADGKDHRAVFRLSGGDDEMQAVPPATAKFLAWLYQESHKILNARIKPR